MVRPNTDHTRTMFVSQRTDATAGRKADASVECPPSEGTKKALRAVQTLELFVNANTDISTP